MRLTRRRPAPPVALAINEATVPCPLEQADEAVEWCLACPLFRGITDVDGVAHVVCQATSAQGRQLVGAAI